MEKPRRGLSRGACSPVEEAGVFPFHLYWLTSPVFNNSQAQIYFGAPGLTGESRQSIMRERLPAQAGRDFLFTLYRHEVPKNIIVN